MQKCDSWGSDLRHQAVSLLGIKVLLTSQGEMTLWGKMIWMGPHWMGKGVALEHGWDRWDILHTFGTFYTLVKFFDWLVGLLMFSFVIFWGVVFCLFTCLFICFLRERVSSLALAAPRSSSVDQAGLKLTRHPPASASASQVLGLKVCTTTAWLSRFFSNVGGHWLTVRATWDLRTHGNC